MKSNKHHLRTAPIVTLFFIIVCLFATPLFADFQRTKIAVLDFGMIGDKLEPEGIGSILSEWFTTSIVKSGRFDVVERAMLQKIIAEQKLATSGMIDESTASELGKILGVKVIITGSILKLNNMIDINARIISVQSGSIIAAESIRSDADKDYHHLVEQLTAKIMQNFPLTGYIVKKDEKSATVDLGLLSGLASGTEFIVYKEGAVIKHPKTGEVLDVEQIQTGKIRISTVRKNVSIGEILSEQGDGIEYGQLVKSVPQNQDAGMVKSTPPPSRIQPPAPSQPAPVPAPVVATQSAPPPPVVFLKKTQTKKVLASVPAQNPLAEKPSIPDTPVRSEEQPPPKAGPGNHVAVFPSTLHMQADDIQGYIESGLPDAVKEVLKDLDGSNQFTLTNLIKDKHLHSISWNQFRPNINGVTEQAKQRGIDYVLLYYFSFWAGQGLINGWGTDFQNPTFRVFLIDVKNATVSQKEDTRTTAQDQLFLELKGMTRNLLEKTDFPH